MKLLGLEFELGFDLLVRAGIWLGRGVQEIEHVAQPRPQLIVVLGKVAIIGVRELQLRRQLRAVLRVTAGDGFEGDGLGKLLHEPDVDQRKFARARPVDPFIPW